MSTLTQESELHCTQLVAIQPQAVAPSLKELTEKISKGTDEEKIEAVKNVIRLHLNGEPIDKLLMPIIHYILPSTNKKLKKLGLYYLENINKHQANGKLREELILVCSHLRNDLLHPNEYVRGVTLRFVCKLNDQELLGPLIDPICQNLEHRHSYVRRNAVLAVFSIYSSHPDLIPDAPERVEKFLDSESEMSSKRNAFLMLFACDQDRAVRYLRRIINNVQTVGDTFQLAILNLLRKLARNNPKEKGKYLRVITNLIESRSPAVLYQCAATLVSLTTNQAAIKAAAGCYIKLLLSSSDSNVKIIVLDRLNELRQKFSTIIESIVPDLLRVLANTTDLDVKKKILQQLIMELVNDRNVLSILDVLKKEIQKSKEVDIEYAKANEGEFRKTLVLAVHKLIPKYPKHVAIVQSFVSMLNDSSGLEVALLLREALIICSSNKSQLRGDILAKILREFGSISDPRIKRVVIWILGEYAQSEEEIRSVISAFLEEQSEQATVPQPETVQTKTEIGKDGTYRTAHADAVVAVPKIKMNLEAMIGAGNFYLACVLATTLVKCIAKLRELNADTKRIAASSMLYLTNLISRYESKMDQDTIEHVRRCIKIILLKKGEDILLKESANALEEIVKERVRREQEVNAEEEKKRSHISADSLLSLSILHAKEADYEFADEDETIVKVTQNVAKNSASDLLRVIQLTGFSDPVYAEAKVTIHQFDILLDVLLVNQTGDTLTNLTLELATVGDLKLCERPVNYTLGPYAQQRIKANIKVSSTETGIIFGNIVYDAHQQSQCIILNDVHIDIMDYISPATCDDTSFRNMWFEFEWENKIPVKSNAHDSLKDYLYDLCKITHMNCLTPESALGDVFLSANLYAKSAFGEDALANVSVERGPDGIEGFVRIRSKTQGIALSLGDRITREQKK